MRNRYVYTILANPFYVARIRAADELVAAFHPGIVHENTFDLVQKNLKENSRNPGAEL